MNCTEKFIKHSERVGARFAEYNAGKSFRCAPLFSFPTSSAFDRGYE